MNIPSVSNILKKKNKAANEGYIVLRIGLPGRNAPIYKSYGYKIKSTDWNAEDEVVKKTNEDYNQINIAIAEYKDQLIDIFKSDAKKGLSFSVSYIEEKLRPNQGKGSFMQFYGAFLEVVRKRHSKGYAAHFDGEYKAFKSFGGDNIRFEDITSEFLEKYELSLKVKASTLHTKMKRLKEVIDRAIARELIKPIQIAGYKFPGDKEPETNYLTLEQTETIANNIYCGKYDGDSQLKIICCFFLVECYGGIRFSDWANFSVEKLVHARNFKVRAKKNGEPVYLPLDTFTRLGRIVDYIADNGLVFDLTEQTTNRILRDTVKRELKLPFKLTTHVGRHTCGTLLGEMGYDTRAIADVLGISPDTAKRYIKHTRQSLNFAFEKYGGL